MKEMKKIGIMMNRFYYISMFVLLATLSLTASAQKNQSERFTIPNTYDAQALMEYMIAQLPETDFVNGNDYFREMLKIADQKLENVEWRERIKGFIATDLIQMTTTEDPKPILDMYLAASSTDSIRQKVRNAYEESVRQNSALYSGKPAPDFTFTDKKGNILKLTDFRGKLLFIDIWGTWCVPCIEEIPFIEKLQQRYNHCSDVHIMSIACDKKRERWTAFLAKHPTSWHQYLVTPEGDEVLDSTYHVIGIPRFIIVDRQGRFITSDAMRPSSPEFNDYFDKLVKSK